MSDDGITQVSVNFPSEGKEFLTECAAQCVSDFPIKTNDRIPETLAMTLYLGITAGAFLGKMLHKAPIEDFDREFEQLVMAIKHEAYGQREAFLNGGPNSEREIN